MNIADIYTSTIHGNLRQFATWPVGAQIELGDFGVLEKSWFVRLGNIRDVLGIDLNIDESATGIEFEYKSSGVDEIRGDGDVGMSAPDAHISATLHFANSNSIYFRSIGPTYRFIDNFPKTQSVIMRAFEKQKWEGKWVLVHNQFLSEGTTIVVTSGANAEIKLKGRVEADQELDLASAAVGLKIASQKGVAARIISKEGWAPLFGLSKIRPRNRLLALFGRGGKVVEPLLTATKATAEVRIPGEIVTALEPEVSVGAANELGMKIDDMYHMVELD